MNQEDKRQTRPVLYNTFYTMGKEALKLSGLELLSKGITWEQIRHAVQSMFDAFPRLAEASQADKTFLSQTILAIQWVADAMPVVEVPSLVAAAFAASSADPGVAKDIQSPWGCFAIEFAEPLIYVSTKNVEIDPTGRIPGLLFEAKDGKFPTEPIHTILCNYGEGSDGRIGWTYLAYSDHVTLRQSIMSTEQLFSDDLDIGMPTNSPASLEDVDHRAMALCRAVMRGVLLRCCNPEVKASYKKPLGTSSKAIAARRAKYGRIPDFDRYVITDKIDIDCRPAVAAYLGGSRSSPSVRSLVRGHYKNQPHGPRMSLRRTVWIQPYWRGDEALPIATKSHRLSNDPSRKNNPADEEPGDLRGAPEALNRFLRDASPLASVTKASGGIFFSTRPLDPTEVLTADRRPLTSTQAGRACFIGYLHRTDNTDYPYEFYLLFEGESPTVIPSKSGPLDSSNFDPIQNKQRSGPSASPRREDVSRYAYHATDSSRIDFIQRNGLRTGAAPMFGDAYSEFDDGKHIFFSNDEGYLRGYGGTDSLLRFPWPDDAMPDKNVYGRTLAKQFVSKKAVPPQKIELLTSSGWQPLRLPMEEQTDEGLIGDRKVYVVVPGTPSKVYPLLGCERWEDVHAMVLLNAMDGAFGPDFDPDAARVTVPGVDLSGIDLRKADIRRANLDRANLSGTNLSESRLTEASFRGAKFTKALLNDAYLDRTCFSGANLEGAELRLASVKDADFSDANLEGADLANADLGLTNLSGASITRVDFSYVYLWGAIRTTYDSPIPRWTLVDGKLSRR